MHLTHGTLTCDRLPEGCIVPGRPCQHPHVPAALARAAADPCIQPKPQEQATQQQGSLLLQAGEGQ